MRLVLSFALMVVLGTSALLLSSCDTPESRAATERSSLEARAREASRELVYFRDERTGLCFAFWWEVNGHQGGPAIATVPCDAVSGRLVPSN
jgi:hypothetical protein